MNGRRVTSVEEERKTNVLETAKKKIIAGCILKLVKPGKWR